MAPKNHDRLLDAERDVRAKLDGNPLDFDALLAISNIYRAAAAVRRRAERDILSQHGLSWGGFTILWVLWVWDAMETAQLAAECDLSKGTVTGMVTTLEKQDLVSRTRMTSDRRRVMVALTAKGVRTIQTVFPVFNAFETEMTAGLDTTQRRELARLLRTVVHNAEDGAA
jgi:DNA-binding MarR family transcriptional regulator